MRLPILDRTRRPAAVESGAIRPGTEPMPQPDAHLTAQRQLRGTGIYWSLPVALLLGVAIVIGVVQNTQSVELRYLGWTAHTPLVVVLLIAVLLTATVTALVGAAWRWRRRRQLIRHAELESLRGRSQRPVVAGAAPAESAATRAAPGAEVRPTA